MCKWNRIPQWANCLPSLEDNTSDMSSAMLIVKSDDVEAVSDYHRKFKWIICSSKGLHTFYAESSKTKEATRCQTCWPKTFPWAHESKTVSVANWRHTFTSWMWWIQSVTVLLEMSPDSASVNSKVSFNNVLDNFSRQYSSRKKTLISSSEIVALRENFVDTPESSAKSCVFLEHSLMYIFSNHIHNLTQSKVSNNS
jgi:hypothetical protein